MGFLHSSSVNPCVAPAMSTPPPCNPPGLYRAKSCTHKGVCVWECRNGHVIHTCRECVAMGFVKAMHIMRATQKRESTPEHLYRLYTTRGSSKHSYADRMAKTYPCHCGQALMPVQNVPSYEEIAIMTGSGSKCKVVLKEDVEAPSQIKAWKTPIVTTRIVPPVTPVTPRKKQSSTQDIALVQLEIERLRKEKELKEKEAMNRGVDQMNVLENNNASEPLEAETLVAEKRKTPEPNVGKKQKKSLVSFCSIRPPSSTEASTLNASAASIFSMEKREAELRARERRSEEIISTEIEKRWNSMRQLDEITIKQSAESRAAELSDAMIAKKEAELCETYKEKMRQLNEGEVAVARREEVVAEREKQCKLREDICNQREACLNSKEIDIKARRQDLDRKYRKRHQELEHGFKSHQACLDKSFAETYTMLTMQYNGLFQQLQVAESDLHQQITGMVIDELRSFEHRIQDIVDTARLAEEALEDPKEQYIRAIQCLCKIAPLIARIKRADAWFGTSIVPKEAPVSDLVDVAHRIVSIEQNGEHEQPVWGDNVKEPSKQTFAENRAGACVPGIFVPSCYETSCSERREKINAIWS